MIYIFLSLFHLLRADGLYFDDENKTILSGAIPGTSSVIIPQSVITIKGGPKETDGFAYSIRSTLRFVDFLLATSLRQIESRAFANTELNILNLSTCFSLENIGSYAFEGCKVSEVIFPMNGVLKILYDGCFKGSNILRAFIPSSVEKICYNVFYSAGRLNIIEFASNSNLTSIGQTAFEGTSIEKVKLPRKASISTTSFTSCRKLTEISVEFGHEYYTSEYGILYSKDYKSLCVFPEGLQEGQEYQVKDGVETILDRAFGSCKLTGVSIPPSVTTLKSFIFYGCSKLKWINMTNSIVSLGIQCFIGCSMLEEIIYPTYVSVVPSDSFVNCKSLKHIHFNGSITQIHQNAFKNCISLETFDVGDDVKIINAYAFQGCSNLINVSLPQSIQTLGGGLFEGCHPNLSVWFRDEGKFETDNQYIIYADNKTNVIQMFANPMDLNILLPKTVSKISDGAFASSQIHSIHLDLNIQSVGSRAFANCKELTEVTIAGSPNLGSSVFSDSGISFIDLGGVTSIPSSAFSSSQIKSISIPSTVSEIMSEAFTSSSIQSIIFAENSSLVSIQDKAFSYCKFLTNLTIPKSIVRLGSSLGIGSSIESITIQMNSKMLEISYGAFMKIDSLSSISFSNTTQTLGSFSLASCTSLDSLLITSSITTLADSCLNDCSNLKSIIIDSNSQLTFIADSSLNGLHSLTSIEIKNDCKGFTTSPENNVLYNKNKSSLIKYCSQNPSVAFSIPDSVINIAWCCFENAINLKTVRIPSSINEIPFRAFANCVNLSSLFIGNNVTKVGENAFQNTSLKCGSVKYPKSLKSQLLDAGIPEEALDKCITNIFSLNQDFHNRIAIFVEATSLVISEE